MSVSLGHHSYYHVLTHLLALYKRFICHTEMIHLLLISTSKQIQVYRSNLDIESSYKDYCNEHYASLHRLLFCHLRYIASVRCKFQLFVFDSQKHGIQNDSYLCPLQHRYWHFQAPHWLENE